MHLRCVLYIPVCSVLTSGFDQLCFWAAEQSAMSSNETRELNLVHCEPTFTVGPTGHEHTNHLTSTLKINTARSLRGSDRENVYDSPPKICEETNKMIIFNTYPVYICQIYCRDIGFTMYLNQTI